MDTNSKASLYNSSSYAQRQADKQAIFNNSKYGQAQAAINTSNTSDTTTKKYTLSDGRVLVRPGASNRIDFKALFGSITSDDDTDSSNAATLALFDSMKSTSNSLLTAYEKQSKQRLGLS